ncbi:MAG: hypothetical protein OHK0021_19570 [Bryobacter sp.]
MTILLIFLTVVHVIICLFLIGVVLLQSGKAADLAGAFGGMGSQTTFGPRAAATVLTKATTAAAALFMVTSLSLAILATNRGAASTSDTVLEKTNLPAPAAAPGSTPGATTIPSGTPSVELVDEQGRVIQKNEVEIPKNAPKDGTPVPVKIGKPLPIQPEAKK